MGADLLTVAGIFSRLLSSCRLFYLSSVVVFLFFVAPPVLAGVRDDVRSLEQRVGRNERSLEGQRTQLQQIGDLDSRIKVLTGRIEELDYKLEILYRRFDSLSAVLAGGPDFLPSGDPEGIFPHADMQTNAPGGNDTGKDPLAPVDAREIPPDESASENIEVVLPPDPDAAFDYASRFLLEADYVRAEAAFGLYMEAFPVHSRTADALFRLGEIRLVLDRNADAAADFISFIRTYPDASRAGEAYLKLGTAFSRLGRKEEACEIFKSIKERFPDATSSLSQRVGLEKSRIDCR